MTPVESAAASKEIIRRHWQSPGWTAATLERWKADFEKRLSRTPSAWDQKYAALHIEVIIEILLTH